MCFLWIGSKRKSHDVPCALIRLCNHMGKPERHLWFQEHWNILSNVLFRQAAAKKKMPMLWKSLNCWSCKSEKSKRAKKLMPLVYPSQTFLQTWKVVSYWQQQYHPGYIPKQWKSSYVSNRDSYNNSQEQVGKFFLKVYHSSLEGVLIIQKSDGSGRYSHGQAVWTL